MFTPAPLPAAELGEAERLACLRLIRSENVGPVAFRELINLYGGAAKALQRLPEIARASGRKKPLRVCSVHDAEAELAAARACGAVPLFTIEPHYPALLALTDAPPPLLYAKGRLDLLNAPSIAIVGSRASSAAGMTLAAQFSKVFADAGYAVVSGLARGIDGAAHKAALSRATVGVLAGGLDIVYPPEHRTLQDEIGRVGCLVTEQRPGFTPRGQDFPRRNRIISGISRGVVIVEAAARSGTLVTARYANEQGREVFAVPGHPLDPRAEGTNKLIKDGATLVTEAGDVLRALAPLTGLNEAPAAYPAYIPPRLVPDPVPPEYGDGARDAVLAVLGAAPVAIEALAAVTGLSARSIQVALLELDLAGRLVRPGPGLVALSPG